MSPDDLYSWLVETGKYRLVGKDLVGVKGVPLISGKIKGYPKVEVVDREGRIRHVLKHRLIAFCLFGSIQKGWTVNHKDGCKWNCDPDNLEVGPHSMNIRHSYAMGLQPPIPIGEKHWNAKLTDSQVTEIRHRTDSTYALAREYGVSQSLISYIKRNKRRKKNVKL